LRAGQRQHRGLGTHGGQAMTAKEPHCMVVEHSPTSATGTAWERTPWHATQRAAWDALRKAATSG